MKKDMKKDMRYLCYPYLRESGTTVDFEVRTDSLASHIGLAASFVTQLESVHQDLIYLGHMAYNLNGSIRGKQAINQPELEELSNMYDIYAERIGGIPTQFYLPQGCTAASYLHLARSEAKKTVRILHKVSLEREVPKELLDYAHLLANLLFLIAVYVNQEMGVPEIVHVSRCYDVKKMGGNRSENKD